MLCFLFSSIFRYIGSINLISFIIRDDNITSSIFSLNNPIYKFLV